MRATSRPRAARRWASSWGSAPRTRRGPMALVRITQERSKIRCIEKHKRTIEALGLRRINHSVVHEDTPQILGMVHLVRYLVRVEPAGASDARPEGAPAARKKVTRPAGRKKTGGKAAAKRRAKSLGASRAPSAGALRAQSDSRAR